MLAAEKPSARRPMIGGINIGVAMPVPVSPREAIYDHPTMAVPTSAANIVSENDSARTGDKRRTIARDVDRNGVLRSGSEPDPIAHPVMATTSTGAVAASTSVSGNYVAADKNSRAAH